MVSKLHVIKRLKSDHFPLRERLAPGIRLVGPSGTYFAQISLHGRKHSAGPAQSYHLRNYHLCIVG